MACQYTVLKTGATYNATDFDDYLKSLPHEVIAKYSPVVAALLGKKVAKFSKSFADVKSEISSLGVKLLASESGDSITVNNITVPPENRNSGIGTKSMKIILDYADSVSKKVLLTPSSDFGGNKSRLISFYKRLGFVENKGANKDYTISETMYREPSGTKFSKSSQQTTSSTVAQVKSWLSPKQLKMVSDGQVKIVANKESLPYNIQNRYDKLLQAIVSNNITGNVRGLYHEPSNTIYLVADMISKDNLSPLLSHELLHKAEATDKLLRDKIDKLDAGVSTAFNQASKGQGDKTSLAAYQRVIKAKTPKNEQLAEFRAYIVEEYLSNPKNVAPTLANLIKNWIASIRMALLRYGMDLGFVRSLTPRDLVALSQIGARVDAVANSQARSVFASTTDKDLETLLSTYASQKGAPSRAELAEALRQYRTIESQYFNADGTPKDGAMIAPNGEQPTKLNKMQWITVRTENFKNWFGDWENDAEKSSKVVDDVTKEPLVVYHGTNKIFSIFDLKKSGSSTKANNSKNAIFFTDNINNANYFSSTGNGTTVSAILEKNKKRINNIKRELSRLDKKSYSYDVVMSSNYENIFKEIKNKEKLLKEEYKALMLSDENELRELFGIEDKSLSPYHSEWLSNTDSNIMPVFLNIKDALVHDFHNDESKAKLYAQKINESLGYDGAILKNVVDPISHNVFIVRGSSQIKSAIGNTGVFGKSNDIRFSVAPRRLTDAWIEWWNNSMFARTDKETGRKEPIKFYHATNAPDLTFFDKEKLGSNTTTHATSGLGFFFSPIKEDVQQYGSNLVEVYLSANKVYAVNSYELPMFDSLDEAKKFSKSLQKKGYDGIWLKDAKYAIVFESNQAKLTSNEEPTQSPDIRYSFAGENAQTVDKYQLAAAKERLANGEDAEQVRKDTGWFIDAKDKRWKFEIDDSNASLKPALKTLSKGGSEDRVMESISYKKNDDGTFTVEIVSKGAKTSSDIIQFVSVSKGFIDSVLPENIISLMNKNKGEDDFVGDFEEAKRIKQDFEMNGFNAIQLGDALEHPALFSAYPELKKVLVTIDPEKQGASFYQDDDGDNVITLGESQQLSSLLHEIQHAIQDNEGFASGGSSKQFESEEKFRRFEIKDFSRMMSDLQKKILGETYSEIQDRFLDGLNGDYSGDWEDRYNNLFVETDKILLKNDSYAFYKEKLDELLKFRYSPYEKYQRLAGEIESRNTEARLGLTAEQRRNTPPSKTQDIPDSEAIVVWNNVDMRSEPANAIPRNYYDVAEKFNIPVKTVVDIASTSPETMIDRWKNSMYPSNTDKPTEFNRIPMGTVALSGYGDINDRYVNFMDSFDVKELGMSEYEEDIKKDKTYKDYLKWAKEGLKPPYITAFTLEDGSIQSINRRRVLAAKEAGVKTIDG